MTREEAIKDLQRSIDLGLCPSKESRKMAIEALEQVTSYETTIVKLTQAISEQEPCEDAISRPAVLDAMYELCDIGETLNENPWRDNPHIDAIADAINNLPPVNPQPKTGHWEVLDKIRAEIEEYKSRQLTLAIGVNDLEEGKQIALEYILAILNKYKAESEE